MARQLFWKLVQRIREEFEDAPGLRMTANEAARFFALDFATCERVLTELLLDGFLARAVDDRYGRIAPACQAQPVRVESMFRRHESAYHP